MHICYFVGVYLVRLADMIDYEEASLLPVPILRRELGGRLEAYRLSRNLRQADVAAEAGIHVTSLSRLERGQAATVDTLIRVLKALGCAERLEMLVPDAKLNPLDPKSANPQGRRRARPREEGDDEPWSWGEEA